MPEVTIYHNPRCSKSRQTLALLQEHGLSPTIVEYLKTPPNEAAIRSLLEKLDLSPAEIIRVKEHRAIELPATDDEQELIRRLATYPEILQRPIVVHGEKARIGRPPEDVLEIL